ncbi:MAG: trehalose-phosphatase [Candidatus Andeanibacterium colombiense]|uniref:Trehalose 6-phosphate phosphatase n=1 Tax=Candidatus Andeanibacterium colombiense TaxID=3121345 RepID=A0AAJ5X6B6_9SPHN|nr:MAG: trehalose-phosphatase [Sphingomonadaceae bacterium]
MGQIAIIGMPPPLGALRAKGPVALFLDFDGTLIDLAPTPDSITVPVELAHQLERMAARDDGRLALVSGRSAADVSEHLGPASIALAGSHGLERFRADGSAIEPRAAAMPAGIAEVVRDFAEHRPGLAYEPKSHGAALHYRAAPRLQAEAIAFVEQLAAAHGLAVKHGKCVVELAPRGADKAAAVHAFMHEAAFRGALPIFIGDDTTDEDGFRAAEELGGFGIVVGERPSGFARYRLSTPAEVHTWLEL